MKLKILTNFILLFALTIIPNVTSAQELTKATVVSVLNVGTIEVNIDGNIQRVRLIGIDIPDIKATKMLPYEKDALTFAKTTLENKTVYLETDISTYDKYKRMQAYVWLEIPSNNINVDIKDKLFNSLIILKGYSKASTIAPNIKYVQTFLQYQNEAKRSFLGLWAYPE